MGVEILNKISEWSALPKLAAIVGRNSFEATSHSQSPMLLAMSTQYVALALRSMYIFFSSKQNISAASVVAEHRLA